MTVILLSLLSVNHFLFSKTSMLNDRMTMQRLLYEALKEYEVSGSVAKNMIDREGKSYTLTIVQDEGKLTRVEIEDGKETFSIQGK